MRKQDYALLFGVGLAALGLLAYYKSHPVSFKPKKIALAVSQSTQRLFARQEDPVLEYLRGKGLLVDKIPWDDKDAKWQQYDLVVLYQTWSNVFEEGYYARKAQYSAWLSSLATQGVAITNSPRVVDAYFDKGKYLQGLQNHVSVVPTIVLEKGQQYNLAELLARQGWDLAVMKLAEGEHGQSMSLVSAADRPEGLGSSLVVSARSLQDKFNSLIQLNTLVLQKFIGIIRKNGEVSCVYVGGALSHAILKGTGENPDEYRTQRMFSKCPSKIYPLSAEQKAEVDKIYQASFARFSEADSPSVARIDVVFDETGKPILMEIEAIDPWFYFYEIANSSQLRSRFLEAYFEALLVKITKKAELTASTGSFSFASVLEKLSGLGKSFSAPLASISL